MRKAHSLKFCFFVLFILFVSTSQVLPNNGITVKGAVVDNVFNETIPGVNIMIKGTSIGTVTNIDGEYTIEVPSKESVLVFSFTGYVTQEVVVGNQTTLDVVLNEDSQTLDEVEIVAIAYSNQDKNLLTSSVSSISTDELLQSPAANITNVLAGALPGVSTIQNSGQPGKDAATIFVRGSGSLFDSQSQPLILVDGVERSFSQIDPNEIESISILKDASSTAVFGVRGANGVILVTTRRGKSGKPQINFNSSMALQQPISLIEQTGSYEFARFWNIKNQLDGIQDPKRYFTREQIEAYRTGSDPIMYPSMDWKKYIFNDLYMQTKNNVNISGGGDKVKYFVSLGYLYQNGLLKDLPGQQYDNNYRYDRFNYRANIDAKLTGTTTMKLGMGGNYNKTQEPRSVVSGTGQDQNPWIIAQIWSHPFAGPGFIDGVRTRVPQDLVPLGEILRDGMFVFYGKGYTLNHQTTLNLDLEVTQELDFITPGLSVSAKGAYDNNFLINKSRTGGDVESQIVYYKSYFDSQGTMPATDPDYDKTLIYVPDGRYTPLNYAEGYGRGQSWYLDGRIDYKRRFGDHDVSGLVLYNQSRNYYPGSYTYIPRNYIGLVGRVTYGYQRKYLFDMNMGYNGSENFAPGKTRFGLFPAFSAGWVASEEQFMQDQQLLDFLKVRASWGRVGNDMGVSSRFMYMPAVWQNAGGYSFGVSTPENSPAFGISTVGNPNVTWETADKNNIGIDIRALANRLSFSADYFTENRVGILISPQSTPSIIATSLPNLNIGEVNNYGYELQVGWNDRIGDHFNYFIDANLSFARNKIIFQDEVPKLFDYMNVTGGSTGRHTDVYQYMRLYQYTDFTENDKGELVLNPNLPQPYQQVYPGDAMYADLNNDGIVDGNDKAVSGFANRPEYMSGLNMGFNWKGVNFSMQWVGATNVSRMLDIEYRIPFTNAGKRGLLTYFYDGSWTPENQHNAVYPRPAEESESWNSEQSTLWLQDASYIRLKSLNIGYTFGRKPLMDKLGISSLGLTLSGYNLITFSALKYIDPESNPNRFGDYPLTKLYSLGLNVNF